MGRSPIAHPRKRLGRGVVDGPQTNSRDKGREGRLYLLPSLSRAPDSIPKLLHFTLLRRRHLLDHGRANVESQEAFNAGNPPSTDGSIVSLLSNPPVPPLEVDHHHSSCCLS
jgi:hypothetical protein